MEAASSEPLVPDGAYETQEAEAAPGAAKEEAASVAAASSSLAAPGASPASWVSYRTAHLTTCCARCT